MNATTTWHMKLFEAFCNIRTEDVVLAKMWSVMNLTLLVDLGHTKTLLGPEIHKSRMPPPPIQHVSSLFIIPLAFHPSSHILFLRPEA